MFKSIFGVWTRLSCLVFKLIIADQSVVRFAPLGWSRASHNFQLKSENKRRLGVARVRVVS